jgi:hypothetical protein
MSSKTQKPKQAPKPKSKPTKDEIIQNVLDGMAIVGLSCFKACQAAGVPNSTFMRWVDSDDKLAEKYAHARQELIERMADEVLELADSEVPAAGDGKKDWQAIQKHKLQVDTRKWLLSKLAPKKYGDKIEVSGDNENPLVQRIEHVNLKCLNDAELAQMQALLQKANGGDE